jgi:hypothetical protein|tara:strand:+ start:563 stop:709 length:147 start_codon:yes stop_codon:yes gene_type:complete
MNEKYIVMLSGTIIHRRRRMTLGACNALETLNFIRKNPVNIKKNGPVL